MSETEGSPAPRRSQREKKATKPFELVLNSSSKRRRTAEESDEEGLEAHGSDAEDDGIAEDNEDDEDDHAAKPKRKAKTAKPKTTKPAAGDSAPKKARAPRTTTAGKGKKTKNNANFDTHKAAGETKIKDDNSLFNAIINPSSALQSTAEDFLESLTSSPAAAQAELINLVLRSCGCNESVDGDEALDYDGVVDKLDDYTEALKKDDTPTYPLTSRHPVFRSFRKSLSSFITRLITTAAEMGSLYTTDLMETLSAWVVAMSSSNLRSFRHTATVIALEVEGALCEVAKGVEKEGEVVGRQKEGEKKRKAASSTKGSAARSQELEKKAEEIRERRTQVAEFLKEFIDGVFIHRYRDLDPLIRASCVHALGQWMRTHPGHFIDTSYLRYVGWVLSDMATAVRVEAVKALAGVYEQSDYISSLNHFTERFKPRLIEMATGDTEQGVRVGVVAVLKAIDGYGLLEDDEREKMCLLVFDEEPKVRKAVNGFVKAVWEDNVEERSVTLSGKVSKKEKDRVGVKVLSSLLFRWGQLLDKAGEDDNAVEGSDVEAEGSASAGGTKVKDVAALNATSQLNKGRTALAVDSLWEELPPVEDWEGLLDLLLLDHSAAREEENAGTRKAKTKSKKASSNRTGGDGDGEEVHEAWRLEEVEETVLLEVFVASLGKSTMGEKDKDDAITNNITRALTTALPRLFMKHQTDPKRINDVLVLPRLMNLDLYLEMRMMTAYANLWDDIIKQFTTHTSFTVLTHASQTIRHLMNTTALSNTNSTKILELEDELSSSLRDAVAGREEIEVASFTEDEVIALAAVCCRVSVLFGMRDLSGWMEESEGGKQSSAWDIFSAIVERGRLGYREEETMVEQALQTLSLHILWKTRSLTLSDDPTPEEDQFRSSLLEQRESLHDKLIEFAVGTQSNTAEIVKRSAFQSLMNLHILFCSAQPLAADGSELPTASLALAMEDEVQYRCAGFVQAEIERYEETRGEPAEMEKSDDDDTDMGGDEEAGDVEKGTGKKARLAKGKNAPTPDEPRTRVDLEHEYVFVGLIATFLRAIRAGAIHVRHSAVVLAHFGRLGRQFDLCCKVIVEILREEGMHNGRGDVVVSVITQAVQESFDLTLKGVAPDETHSVGLSKLLVAALVMRGAQLLIVRRLDDDLVVQIHSTILTWLGKRLTSSQSGTNKLRKPALLMFRALVPLLGSIQPRHALKIKAQLDQVLAQSKVPVSQTLKIWDPYRTYEKRLTAIMAKDKALAAPKIRKGRGKKDAALLTEEETDREAGTENEAAPVASLPRPRPRHRTQNKAVVEAPVAPEDDDDEVDEDQLPVTNLADMEEEEHDLGLGTAVTRSPLKAVYGSKSRIATPWRLSPARSESGPENSASRKRARSEDEADDRGGHDEATATHSLSREATPASDLHIRRKRIRH